MPVRIGFIGTGNMGKAMIRGWAERNDLELRGTDLNREQLAALAEEFGLVPADDAKKLVRDSDYVILAVKPQHADRVLAGLRDELGPETCLVSICAGLTLERLANASGGRCRIVRVMPNTPALIGAGVFALCLEHAALTDDDKNLLPELFGALGQVHIMAEKDFDAFTAVIGSGPAYVCYFIEALVESAVALGIPRPKATEMVVALVEGSAAMARETGTHPGVLREMVTSPAGTTVEALIHLDRKAVRAALIDAVAASHRRSKELGQS